MNSELITSCSLRPDSLIGDKLVCIEGAAVEFLREMSRNHSVKTNTAGHTKTETLGGSTGKRVGAEKRLIRDLMENYDKFSRPRLSIKHPVTVLVDLIVIQFEDLVSI